MELPEYETLTSMIHAKLKEVGRNQKDLAEAIGVNDGMISRYLAGESEAPYKKLRAMHEVLREWEDEQRQPATELMSETLISTTLQETRREAADKIQENYFSQLPVRETEGGEVVGIVTDKELMKVHDDNKLIREMKSNGNLQHAIEVSKDEDYRLIEKILEEGHPAVLVVDDGNPEGIITRADLLATASHSV